MGVLKPLPKSAYVEGLLKSKAMAVIKPLPKFAFVKRVLKVGRNRLNQPGCLAEHESETIRLAEFILAGTQQRREWKTKHEQKRLPSVTYC